MSTPFTNDVSQRRRHLLHLQMTLDDPIILTQTRLFPEFLGIQGLRLQATEDLESVAQDDESKVEYGF